MNELIIISVIFLAGLATARLFLNADFPIFNAAAAFPLGLCAWFLSYAAVYFFPFSSHQPLAFTVAEVRIAFIVLCGLTFLLIGATRYRRKLTLSEMLSYAAVWGVLFAAHVALKHINIMVINAEPYGMLEIENSFSASLQGGVPVFNRTLFSLSPLIGDDYVFATFPQYTAISLILLMCYVTFGELRRQSASRAYAAMLAALPPLILFSSYVGVWQLFYTNHHLLAATYVFLFAASCWLAIAQRASNALFIGAIALSAFSLTRMEGLLCAIPIFCIFVSHPEIAPRDQRRTSLLFLLCAALWSTYLIWTLSMTNAGKVGSGAQHLAILALAAASALCVQANRWKAGQQMLRHFHKLVPAGVGLTLLLFIRLKSEHMLLNIYLCLLSLLNDTHGMWLNPINIDADQHGGWGNIWFFILGAAILIWVLRPASQQTRDMDAFGLAGFTAIGIAIAIIYFAGPYYAGLTDSANRIFFHFTPLVLVWAITQIGMLHRETTFTEDAED